MINSAELSLIALFFLGAFVIFVFAVLFEGELLKIFLKKNRKEILKLSAGINLAAAFVLALLGISIVLLTSVVSRLFPAVSTVVVILGWIAPPLIIIWIKRGLYKNHWKDVSAEKLLAALAVSNIIIYIIFSLWVSSQVFTALSKAQEKARRISCSSNLKSIGLTLLQYAMDYDDYLPDKPGAAGLEQLRCNDYLTDPGCFACPSQRDERAEDGQKLSEKTVGYIYQNGYKSTNPDKSKIPVMWDKPDNHIDYGNVLFLDGHIKSFEGKDWMEQAGIKKRK
jgi:prepilin-type processing-associated H-X9-DG protein